MNEPGGATIAMPCQKGCGKPVLVSPAQAELLRGLPAAGRFQHEHCEGENDTLTVPTRTYQVQVTVHESAAAEAEAAATGDADAGEVVARITAEVDATSFAEACPRLGEKMSAIWARIVEAAALADTAP